MEMVTSRLLVMLPIRSIPFSQRDYQNISSWMESVQELLTLESGTYYVVTNMFRDDTEVHNGETGYNGYNCGFKLIVP